MKHSESFDSNGQANRLRTRAWQGSDFLPLVDDFMGRRHMTVWLYKSVHAWRHGGMEVRE